MPKLDYFNQLAYVLVVVSIVTIIIIIVIITVETVLIGVMLSHAAGTVTMILVITFVFSQVVRMQLERKN